MFKKIITITTLFVGSTFLTANAASLSINPSSLNIDTGNIAQVDVVLSGLESGGLDEAVAAYDLTVSFDGSILSFSNLSVDESQFDFGTGFFPVDYASDSSISGEVSFNLLSWELDFDLQFFQGDSLTLATLAFNTVDIGTSALGFSFIDVTGLNFNPLSLSTFQGSSITVNTSSAIPEPSVLIMVVMGITTFICASRKKFIL